MMHATAAVRRDPVQTRQSLLQAAFDEIYLRGFQGTSLDHVLERAGVTKGALYHHFRNKMDLGYAVVDEVIKPMVITRWLQALAETDDPLTAIMRVLENEREIHGEESVVCGCPLNNLASEMSPIDEGFRQRVHALFESWMRGIASALRQGQAHGTVRREIDPDQVATFILASIEGTIGLGKNAQSLQVFEDSFAGLEMFLESLRPVDTTPAPASA